MQELRLAFRGARVGALVLAFLAAGLAFPGVAASETSINDRVLVEEGGKLFVQAGGRRFEVSDVVTVKFPPGTPRSAKGSFSADRGAKIIRENRLGYVDLQVPSGKTAVEFAAELESTGALELVEINTIGEYLATPDDTLFDYQWGLNNTGQTGGTPDADIDAPEAWDLEIGSPDVIVAVLDSGTEILHEDLECNIWVNPGEDLDNDGVVWDPDDMNGIDDDGNTLVDDLVGWDFGNNNNDPRSGTYHGTHVAGIVGACGGNATGIIGVAGGLPAPGSRLMPLAVGDFSPDGAVLDDAILHAADMGAHVITLSLTVPQTQAIDDALKDAYDAGVFINNASGNNDGPVTYPATHADVVAVGATDHDDVRASPATTGWGSNHGPELEVVAPGVGIWSTRLGDTYASGDGTSFASPHVAGVAALLFSSNPGLTNEDVRHCIQETAEDEVGDPAEDVPGRDDFYGFGRLNARAALDACGGGALTVEIDIMPSDPGNNLNLRAGKGASISVAILSVGGFEAPNLIDPSTLKFGPREANIWGSPRVRDVDGDGNEDLVVKFLTQQTGIPCGDTHAILSGFTFDFEPISGSDAINTFNCPRNRKRY